MKEDQKIVIYQTEDGQTQIDVRLENETVWLTANQMAILFDRDEKTVRKHINNVFSEGELEKINNTHFLRVDGVKQLVATYNLDVIISVGYRVKSRRRPSQPIIAAPSTGTPTCNWTRKERRKSPSGTTVAPRNPAWRPPGKPATAPYCGINNEHGP